MTNFAIVLELFAGLLAVLELIRSRGWDLLAWAILFVVIALLVVRL